MFALAAFFIMLMVFGRGHQLEQEGKRTDFLGRPNNHPDKGEQKRKSAGFSGTYNNHPHKEEMD